MRVNIWNMLLVFSVLQISKMYLLNKIKKCAEWVKLRLSYYFKDGKAVKYYLQVGIVNDICN